MTLPLISILSFLNARAGETSEISIYFLSPLKLTYINSAAIPFLLNPLSLSFHPVHPGKHRGSEGWINKGVKVEHNSLRSAFSGTLTQRNTQAHMRLHKATVTNTHRHSQIHMHASYEWLWRGDGTRRRREKTIHTSHHLHAPALGWEGHEQARKGSEIKEVGGGRRDGRMRTMWGVLYENAKCSHRISQWSLFPPFRFPFFSLFSFPLLFFTLFYHPIIS